MRVLKLTIENILEIATEAAIVLKRGGLVIFPTETCYGAGVLADNQAAVDKLLRYKKRPPGKPISVAVTSMQMAEKYVEVNEAALEVYNNFLPGPVTVISNYKGGLAVGLAAENNTLGIRIPDFPFVLEMVKQAGYIPLSATSANLSGQKTPYIIRDILDNASAKNLELIDLVIDAGELPKNPPSTVIDTTTSDLQVIRAGEINFGKQVVDQEINKVEDMIKAGSFLIESYFHKLKSYAVIILFNAEMGAGKTHFVKGIGQYIGVEEVIKSPTYALVNEYDFNKLETKGKLIHLDAWRLESLQELKDLDLESYYLPGNIIAIEWSGAAVKYFNSLAKQYKTVNLAVDIKYTGENTRRLIVKEY